MKRAKIYIDDVFCGILTEEPEGCHFKYDEQYMSMADAKALSPTSISKALDTDKITLSDSIDTENGVVILNGDTIFDHNWQI